MAYDLVDYVIPMGAPSTTEVAFRLLRAFVETGALLLRPCHSHPRVCARLREPVLCICHSTSSSTGVNC